MDWALEEGGIILKLLSQGNVKELTNVAEVGDCSVRSVSCKQQQPGRLRMKMTWFNQTHAFCWKAEARAGYLICRNLGQNENREPLVRKAGNKPFLPWSRYWPVTVFFYWLFEVVVLPLGPGYLWVSSQAPRAPPILRVQGACAHPRSRTHQGWRATVVVGQWVRTGR